MTGTLGYGLQAAVGGFQTGFNMAQKKTEMEWQKKQQKKLEEKQLKIQEGATIYSNLVAQLGADGTYSEDDMMKLNTAFLASGYEVQEVLKSSHNAIQTMKKDELENDYAILDMYAELTENLDPKDIQGVFDTIKGMTKSEKGLNLFEAFGNLQDKRYKISQEKKPWEEASVLPSDVRTGYLRQEGVDIPEAPTFNEKKFNWKLEQVNSGKITFEQFLKSENMDITPDKVSAVKEKLNELDKLGATAEEKKNYLLGSSGGGSTLTPSSQAVEGVRENILKAPTIEDARRIDKNNKAKYGDTAGIPDVDKYWSDERVKRMDSLKQNVDRLLDEKKSLRKGTISKEELAGMGIETKNDTEKVELVYKQIRKEYIKYKKALEKMGVDVSQYPELMSYETYLKADATPGTNWNPFNWGKGQKPPVY